MATETEQELRELIADAVYEYLESSDEALPSVTSFAEAGLFTNNEGLVLRFPSGAEFQLTIVRSR